jgi:GTP 3',8-cyclase
MILTDAYGRRVNYLRLSVTDRCNLRCSYCMPAAGVDPCSHQEVLSYEELLRIAKAAISLGVEKIRVTGGEPLVRRGIVDFLAQLAALPGLKVLAVTSNGLRLGELAQDLKRAGVTRLNISLDSLDPATFAAITRRDAFAQVMEGIDCAARAGFPIKLNTVVMRGVNDHEVEEFAALSLKHPFAVRFIEYMPMVGEEDAGRLAVSGEEILSRIAARYPLLPLPHDKMGGPAKNFRIAGAPGSVGVITPMSNHFCGDCNRIRVSATGQARNCLFARQTLDLRPVLAGGDPEALRRALSGCIAAKGERHGVSWQEPGIDPITMAAIGG